MKQCRGGAKERKPRQCAYVEKPGVILKGHAEGVEMWWQVRKEAEAWCTSRGDACGGLTHQHGRYEARAARIGTPEGGKDANPAPTSYLKPEACLPVPSPPGPCEWHPIRHASLKEVPLGNPPDTATFDTLDAAKQRCLDLGRACGGVVVRDSKLAGALVTFQVRAGHSPAKAAAETAHVRLCASLRAASPFQDASL